MADKKEPGKPDPKGLEKGEKNGKPEKIDTGNETPVQEEPPKPEGQPAAEGESLTSSDIGCFEILHEDSEDFDIKPKKNPLPANQIKLQREIYAVDAVYKILFRADQDSPFFGLKKREKTPDGKPYTPKYYANLKVLMQVAEAGLKEDKIVDPEMAFDALQQIKAKFVVREGRELKKQYLLALLILAFGFWFVAIILALGLDAFFPKIFDALPFGLVWAGAMTGVWVSVALKRTTLSFEELPEFIDARLVPFFHLLFTGILALVFGLLLKVGLIKISINDISLNEFFKSMEMSFVLGFLSGFSEKALSLRILKKAQDVFGR